MQTTILQEGKSVGEKLEEVDTCPKVIVLWIQWLHPDNEDEGILIGVEAVTVPTQPQS